jgi:hypothetical protein
VDNGFNELFLLVFRCPITPSSSSTMRYHVANGASNRGGSKLTSVENVRVPSLFKI